MCKIIHGKIKGITPRSGVTGNQGCQNLSVSQGPGFRDEVIKCFWSTASLKVVDGDLQRNKNVWLRATLGSWYGWPFPGSCAKKNYKERKCFREFLVFCRSVWAKTEWCGLSFLLIGLKSVGKLLSLDVKTEVVFSPECTASLECGNAVDTLTFDSVTEQHGCFCFQVKLDSLRFAFLRWSMDDAHPVLLGQVRVLCEPGLWLDLHVVVLIPQTSQHKLQTRLLAKNNVELSN